MSSDSHTHTNFLAAVLQPVGEGTIRVNDRYVVHSFPETGFHIVCFDDQSGAPQQSGRFFDIGTFRLVPAPIR
jgi:hypothetical protein